MSRLYGFFSRRWPFLLVGQHQHHQYHQLARFSTSTRSSVKNTLLLTLACPTECYMFRVPVASVSVPGSEGDMTLTNHHSSLVARLKAGEVLVREKDAAEPKRFFLSDGFVFVNAPQDDSNCTTAEVLGVELIPSSMLDKEAAAQQLQQLLQQAAASGDQWTKAKALLGQDLLGSVIRAAP